jgi:hypothetical protein
MKSRTKINYTFLLLAIGIVSTILSNPILAQTEGNSQNQTGTTSGDGGQQQGGGESTPSIGSIEDLKKLTTPEGPPPKTSNDTTPLFQQLGKESGTGNQTGGQQQPSGQEQGQQQEGNQTAGTTGGQQQEGNQTAGTTGGQQQEGNQTGGPLGEVGEAIGKLFQ